MSLNTFVKVSKISSLSDARYCAGMMVDMLGFDLYPESKDYVSTEAFKEITDWIAGVTLVGECYTDQVELALKVAETYQLDWMAINSISLITPLFQKDIKLIFHYEIETNEDITDLEILFDNYADQVKYVTVHLKNNSLETDLLNIIEKAITPCIKAYEISTNTIQQINSVWHGIQLEGTPEDQPGFKDYGVVMDVLELLEED